MKPAEDPSMPLDSAPTAPPADLPPPSPAAIAGADAPMPSRLAEIETEIRALRRENDEAQASIRALHALRNNLNAGATDREIRGISARQEEIRQRLRALYAERELPRSNHAEAVARALTADRITAATRGLHAIADLRQALGRLRESAATIERAGGRPIGAALDVDLGHAERVLRQIGQSGR